MANETLPPGFSVTIDQEYRRAAQEILRKTGGAADIIRDDRAKQIEEKKKTKG